MIKTAEGIRQIIIIEIVLIVLNTINLNITKNNNITGPNENMDLIYILMYSIGYIIWMFLISNETKKESKIVRIETIIKELIVLINFVTGFILILTNDLFEFFIFLELFSITIYFLFYFNSIGTNLIYSSSLGIYYFIISSLSSLMILFNISSIYSLYGILNISELSLFDININIMILGILVKIGVAPFQFWVVSLYEKLDKIIIVYLSIIPKFIYIYLLIKLNVSSSWLIFYFSSILSLIIGSIYGLKEQNVYKILANSSIFNMGFLLLAFLYKNMHKNILEFLMLYSINTFNIIFIFILFHFSFLKDLFLQPTTYLLFFISVLSLIGIPPLGGFFAKIKILEIVTINIKDSPELNTFLISIIIITILISTSFYLKFISYSLTSFKNYNLFYSFDSGYFNNTFLSLIISFSSLFIIFYSFFYPVFFYLFNLV